MEPGVRRLRRGHDRVTHTARRFSRSDLADLLRGAGLDVVRATGAYAFLVPPAAVLAVRRARPDGQRRGTQPVRPRWRAPGAGASAERAMLRHVDLPTGLSVIAIAVRPAAE